MNGRSENMVKEMVTNAAMSFGKGAKRQVLIMDEVDGMSAGDRGGVLDLIQSIKVCKSFFYLSLMRGSNNFVYKISKVPIICICNDAWCQKLRSLKDMHCLHIAFHKPTKQQIRVRMMNIASREGLQALM